METMMPLTPDPGTPGLWLNPAWQPGTPGTFAVLIGCSAYPYLAGGRTPAPETFSLGQLRVSALTAYEMFRWLRSHYHISGCPVALCWLLLSPTDAELAYAPGMAEHLTAPTLANCTQALRQWHYRMSTLPQSAAEASRALFFFSGHGLEVHQEQQILLPCDYLAPPGTHWNDAISTENLKHGLASLYVPQQFFFLDACRNDHQALRSKRVTGTEILSEDEAFQNNPNLISPLLYATASGQQAFQPPEPQQGISLFGRALLDGLQGTPDITLDCQGPLCHVKLYSLQGYMKQRIMALIAAAHAQVSQPLKLSGLVDDVPLTTLERRAVAATRAMPLDVPERGVTEILGTVPTAYERAVHVEHLLGERFSLSLPVAPDVREDEEEGLFGSPHVAALWRQRTRLYALQQRRWLDAAKALVLHRIDRDREANSYRAEISIANRDTRGHWLEIVDDSGTAHGCVLPADQYEIARYALEFNLTLEAQNARCLSRLSAYLSPASPGPLGVAATLWQRYRTADLGEAVHTYEMSVLELTVREKLDSPLAATVAALVLLRANRLDLLHDWSRNLANWFRDRPDGAVLWAEQVVRQRPDGQQAALADAAEYLVRLLHSGLPYSSEGLAYAARLSTLLQRSRAAIPATWHAPLAQLDERLQNALTYFRPGGLFAAYAGFSPQHEPEELLGPFAVS